MMKFLHTGHCIPPDFTARRGSKDVRNSTAVFAMCSFCLSSYLRALALSPRTRQNKIYHAIRRQQEKFPGLLLPQ
jgi:hypothetical protein